LAKLTTNTPTNVWNALFKKDVTKQHTGNNGCYKLRVKQMYSIVTYVSEIATTSLEPPTVVP